MIRWLLLVVVVFSPTKLLLLSSGFIITSPPLPFTSSWRFPTRDNNNNNNCIQSTALCSSSVKLFAVINNKDDNDNNNNKNNGIEPDDRDVTPEKRRPINNNSDDNSVDSSSSRNSNNRSIGRYDLGLGKNRPIMGDETSNDDDSNEAAESTKTTTEDVTKHWIAPVPFEKPDFEPFDQNPVGTTASSNYYGTTTTTTTTAATTNGGPVLDRGEFVSTRKMVARDQKSQLLRGAIWDEEHYTTSNQQQQQEQRPSSSSSTVTTTTNSNKNINDDDGVEATVERSPGGIDRPSLFYPDIDMSIPTTVYNETYDAVWDLLRWEAYEEAQREPLLVSFLYSTILNHKSLESSLAFLLSNRLSSPMLISTQLQSFILDALESNEDFRRAVRADMLAVRDRDPACTCLPDVFLYFKGFQALQAHRVSHYMWKRRKTVLAHYLQSAVSNQMQIDIHPNATMGMGIMLDHGTGIVVGETAMVGNNCSILHHVTLGGSGKKGVDRHPKVQDGVLLGAGATVLGNVVIGEGCQVGAGTLVISDLPAHSVAVGVPAKVIGSFIDVTEQPSNEMNQMIGDNLKIATFESFGI